MQELCEPNQAKISLNPSIMKIKKATKEELIELDSSVHDWFKSRGPR